MPQRPHSHSRIPAGEWPRVHACRPPIDPSQRRVLHVRALLAEQHARQVARERELDRVLRGLAQRNTVSAPPSFAQAVRVSLTHGSTPESLGLTSVWSAALPLEDQWARAVALAVEWFERDRRTALGALGALLLAMLVSVVGLFRDPAILLTALGTLGAMFLAALATAHLVSTAVFAVMGTSLVALCVALVYVALATVWIRLVRTPLEA